MAQFGQIVSSRADAYQFFVDHNIPWDMRPRPVGFGDPYRFFVMASQTGAEAPAASIITTQDVPTSVAAFHAWESAVPDLAPLAIPVYVEDLPGGELGESHWIPSNSGAEPRCSSLSKVVRPSSAGCHFG